MSVLGSPSGILFPDRFKHLARNDGVVVITNIILRHFTFVLPQGLCDVILDKGLLQKQVPCILFVVQHSPDGSANPLPAPAGWSFFLPEYIGNGLRAVSFQI